MPRASILALPWFHLASHLVRSVQYYTSSPESGTVTQTRHTWISPVIVHDGVQPVGNGDDSTASKLITDGLLDKVIRFHVNSSSGFIKHQDLGFPQ